MKIYKRIALAIGEILGYTTIAIGVIMTILLLLTVFTDVINW